MNEQAKSRNFQHRKPIYESLRGKTGLDIGSGPDPLVIDGATVRTWDVMPGADYNGDAQYLDCLPDEMFDFVSSSHCLEHMRDVTISLTHWARVLKPGGTMLVTVPDFWFYERGCWPSMFNPDHKQRFSFMPMPDEANCWTAGRMIRLADSLGLDTEEVFLELNGFDFAAHACRFLIDQTLSDAVAQVCYVWRKK